MMVAHTDGTKGDLVQFTEKLGLCRQKVIDWMANHEKEVPNLWMSIDRGDFDGFVKAETGTLESSQNKLHLVPNYVRKQMVLELLPDGHLSFDAIKLMDKKNKPAWLQLLCALSDCEPACAVPDRMIDKTVAAFEVRRQNCKGIEATTLQISDEGLPNFAKVGFYQLLEGGEDGNAAGGATGKNEYYVVPRRQWEGATEDGKAALLVKLPTSWGNVLAPPWKLTDNYTSAKAVLTDGDYTTCKIEELFTKQKVEFQPSLKVDTIPLMKAERKEGGSAAAGLSAGGIGQPPSKKARTSVPPPPEGWGGFVG